MKKVITYGTYDLLHYGHIRLLERAKALGDYLIVGVTSDNYDKYRGKINNQQSLVERIAAIKETGLADLIIVEEYEGQKIEDIKKYDVDIFAIGSDWEGKFDYLSKYCEVKYLDRTLGVSSSDIRSEQRKLKMGILGDTIEFLEKFYEESKYVNGLEIVGFCSTSKDELSQSIKEIPIITNDIDELLSGVEAVYVKSSHKTRYNNVKYILEKGKHVLCEAPLTLSESECRELYDIAKKNNCMLLEGIRTAYSTAYQRLLLLIDSEKIGNVVSIDLSITSMNNKDNSGNSLYDWGANALLPIFQILGTNYIKKDIITHKLEDNDSFTKINFLYKNATASMLVAEGAKSEGDLTITGTKGYIYVPAPWWKTDYFEVRYEDTNNNKRYFYQLDGEGIRYELVSFLKEIQSKTSNQYINNKETIEISKVMEDFKNNVDVIEI